MPCQSQRPVSDQVLFDLGCLLSDLILSSAEAFDGLCVVMVHRRNHIDVHKG